MTTTCGSIALSRNAASIDRPTWLLAPEEPPEALPSGGPPGTPPGLTLGLTTEALTGVDAYVDGRPVGTTAVVDGANTLRVPLDPAPGVEVTVRLEGFAGNELVASRMLTATGN